ncbi:alpha-hydroxy-acid oxidizing protein [Modestobacter sp. I12A-02628]|uniref:Alpha-hydroxy-acid oxidizing protein n=1 Tax=Goekera deserti TaxID=2497753 RepID=A0A7K3WHN9_9ACTN|nr:alpha-hydroxy-acid oxidizing protein [Goekera deserti]NDI48588.1 alpha-hydroxy-acid oxidizing protein [Goekera deserti]NEL55033.1 alpha-hydroxy-acid oxidizing protein [Goekera deserti]
MLADHVDSARSALPPAVWDYYSAGSGEETTLAEAEAAWRSYRLRPRVLHDVSDVDTGVTLLGTRVASPFVVAPMAFHALAHPDGECATVAGAGAAGSLTVVSTRASRTLEDIGAAATGPWWFQAYVMRDRGLTEALVQRAAAAGATAVVLTVDTPYVGRKHKVAGVRFAVPDDEYLVNLAQHLLPGAVGREAAEQDPSITPDVIGRLADVGGLPVLVKGVLRGDEAVRCLDAGAAGVVVSNHGGRQLDRGVPSALALPDVVQAVAGHAPVLVDGGIRTGLDALVALGLGADAVLVGRPLLWALATGGAGAVTAALDELTADLRHVLAVAGAARTADLDPSMVIRL